MMCSCRIPVGLAVFALVVSGSANGTADHALVVSGSANGTADHGKTARTDFCMKQMKQCENQSYGYQEGEVIEIVWAEDTLILSFVNAALGAVLSVDSIEMVKVAHEKKWYCFLVVAAGFNLGICFVFATHFVGMKAAHLGSSSIGDVSKARVEKELELYMTVVSGMGAWLFSSVSVHFVAKGPIPTTQAYAFSFRDLAVAGPLLGMSVLVMHYMGMLAQCGLFYTSYSVGFTSLSVVTALTLPSVVLFLLFADDHIVNVLTVSSTVKKMLTCAALTVGLLVVHFSGVRGTTFHFRSKPPTIGMFMWSIHRVKISDYFLTVLTSVWQLVFSFIVYLFLDHSLDPDVSETLPRCSAKRVSVTSSQHTDPRAVTSVGMSRMVSRPAHVDPSYQPCTPVDDPELPDL